MDGGTSAIHITAWMDASFDQMQLS